jgi:hypothetical protein
MNVVGNDDDPDRAARAGAHEAQELEPEPVQAILRANEQIARGEEYLTSAEMRERLQREVLRRKSH